MESKQINGKNIVINECDTAIFDFLVDRLNTCAEEAIAARGFFSLALSGGTTPKNFLLFLSEKHGFRFWENTHIFVVDERYVSHWDENSNVYMITQSLVSKLQLHSSQLHFVPFLDSLEESAGAYRDDVRSFFQLEGSSLPQFDCILLGMGQDGHTASLFPKEKYREKSHDLVVAVDNLYKGYQRTSLSLPVINNAQNVLFLVTGKGKRDILKKVVIDNDVSLPATHVAPHTGSLEFVVDAEAAQLL